jgi:hypothetical protein
MNRDDIIKLAQEAGVSVRYGTLGAECWIEDLERFATLVAAAEREACAKVCEKEAGELDTVRESLAAVTCAAAIRARGEE